MNGLGGHRMIPRNHEGPSEVHGPEFQSRPKHSCVLFPSSVRLYGCRQAEAMTRFTRVVVLLWQCHEVREKGKRFKE